jgi:hypothetical protein
VCLYSANQELQITGNRGGQDQENIRPEYDGFANVVVKQ